jgi:serine/threonine-protein kinase
MALEVGSRLGHYDVTAKIGQGGMGEVWQATDTKLNRQVALKILPEAFATDSERLARFQREAQVLASLNHPGIAAIYGLEEEGDTRALVLELVEGPTLADRIAQGPIPIDEALPIARQIAEALEAAHEAGVIHRDLKPANIKVKSDGTVKVLDFGLAKALDTTPEGDPSLSPTLTAAATQMGVIMGTAAYMSPEQASGETADKRSDIWSFGVVLFEMLTGQRLFTGKTVAHVMAKVLDRDLDLTVLPTTTPAPIKRLLRRCLEREQKRRLRDAGEALAHLEEAATAPGDDSVVVPVAQSGGWRQALPWVVGIALGGVLAGLAVWSLLRPTPPLPRSGGLARFEIITSDTAPLGLSGGVALAVSPDGRHIVYTGRQREGAPLYVRAIDQLDTVPLRGSAGGHGPFVSSDGEWVGYQQSRSLYRIAVGGGVPFPVAQSPHDVVGASWATDGQIIFGSNRAGLFSVSVAGGEPIALTIPNADEGAHMWPSVTPDEHLVFFVTVSDGSPVNGELAVLDRQSGNVTRLGLSGLSPKYVRTGHLLYGVADGAVHAVGFDLQRLEAIGAPVPVVQDVHVTPNGAGNFAVSDDGRLTYVSTLSTSEARQSLVWVDRQGQSTATGLPIAAYRNPQVSGDGNLINYVIHDSDAGYLRSSNWTFDLVRNVPQKLDFASNQSVTRWSPDGNRYVFSADPEQGLAFNLYARDRGRPEPRQLTSTDFESIVASWSADGEWVVYIEDSPETGNDIWMVPSDGSAEPTLILGTSADETQPTASPDGSWLAYRSDGGLGTAEIFVEPFLSAGVPTQVSAGGGTEPAWSVDGRELYYRGGTHVMAVSVGSGEELELGRPAELFEDRFARTSLRIPNYAVAPDGRFLMVEQVEEPESPRINVVLNWYEELRRLVPVD